MLWGHSGIESLRGHLHGDILRDMAGRAALEAGPGTPLSGVAGRLSATVEKPRHL